MKLFGEMCHDYEGVAILARGGQKMVFSAHHKVFGDCVIKLFFQLNDPRSLREIQIERDMGLELVPQIFETGVVEYEQTETLYIVEEKICGTELRTLLDRGVRFSLKEIVEFLEQGLNFICQIEKKGIIHRDIKPENIIRTTEGKIFFIDFGIARIIGECSLTKTEALIGPHTPGYAAPEQFNNLKKEIDSRADIFSLGVVGYECITGKNPFREGATDVIEILQKTETTTPIEFSIPGDTQRQCVALLSTMMGKYPSRRPKTAAQALNWLIAAKPTFIY